MQNILLVNRLNKRGARERNLLTEFIMFYYKLVYSALLGSFWGKVNRWSERGEGERRVGSRAIYWSCVLIYSFFSPFKYSCLLRSSFYRGSQ